MSEVKDFIEYEMLLVALSNMIVFLYDGFINGGGVCK